MNRIWEKNRMIIRFLDEVLYMDSITCICKTSAETSAKAPAAKQRDYLFDNYKALLIVLVVMGHFIEPCYRNNEFLYTLKWLIVSFHMPAFIFISGYFSRRELKYAVILKKLLMPYIVYEFIYYFFYIFILHKETGLYLLYPKFSLWYLLALFVWRAATPWVKKCPHYMAGTVAAGLLIGCSDMADNFLSLPRILYFYPFFLTGMKFNRNVLTRLKRTSLRLLCAAAIVLFTGCILYIPVFDTLSVKVFYGRYNYDFLGQDILSGILWRCVCYMVGFAMTFAVMLLVPSRQTCFSYIGTRTMAIYLFHGLTYSYLKDCTTLLKDVSTLPQSLLLLFCCILLAAVFSVPQLSAFTNKIADLRLTDTIAQTVWLASAGCRRLVQRKAASFRWFLYTRNNYVGLTHMMFLGGRF